MLRKFTNREGHIFVVSGGKPIVVDATPTDPLPPLENAIECNREEFIRAIISGLVKQCTLLGEILQGVPSDRLLTIVSSFAKETADDISTLKQAAHAERRRGEIHGELSRAVEHEDSRLVEKLQAERATLPHVQYRKPEHHRIGIVRASELPPIEEPQIVGTSGPKSFFRRLFKS